MDTGTQPSIVPPPPASHLHLPRTTTLQEEFNGSDVNAKMRSLKDLMDLRPILNIKTSLQTFDRVKRSFIPVFGDTYGHLVALVFTERLPTEYCIQRALASNSTILDFNDLKERLLTK
ncbi:hypothetical protein O9G_005321 [Rozella allomycis CSF55]|uniref:Uncharacterized protein n=1 Tax=Rozella allomycis (strain CSF55) TaxID=988480 RepID=A0A075ATP7_ROZAC|nr:hypothetical protein O9G_005321 [Rozella allomycis CSF55]|eukprot:EPZ32070.1 hypothetical protein O9G_005321 [Rozella allomycis CSF55]